MQTPASWHLRSDSGRQILALVGDWIAQSGVIPSFPDSGLKSAPKGQPLQFDTSQLGRWDSGLIEFLWGAKRAANTAGITLDGGALPAAAWQLLGLLPDSTATAKPPARLRRNPLQSLGTACVDLLTEIGVQFELGGSLLAGVAAAAVGKTRMRGADLLDNIRDAGPAALPIVGVVNFLVGAILAFIGAAQLRRFAADIYVANLVGLAQVREMAAVMTAIVMAGRTGGAYAARIATMEGGEEIDALQVFGIPISSYLLLPAVLSLVCTMPLLYLYGCIVGMTGGFIVAVGMFNMTGASYLHQTLGAVPLSQFVFGFAKSIAFAAWIGITSCRIGLKSGRSSADVGVAATRAVVTGIVGVIALDAIFAVIANAIDI